LNKSLSKNICVLIVSKTNLNKRICRHNKHNDSDVMSEAEEEEEEKKKERELHFLLLCRCRLEFVISFSFIHIYSLTVIDVCEFQKIIIRIFTTNNLVETSVLL
jgi:hypothetical protein